MPNILTNIRIDEVSSVDKGAGKGVRVMLMKRRDTEATPMNEVPIMKVAKQVVAEGDSRLTEHAFTKMVHDHAQLDRRSGESPEQAFTRVFTANTEEGLLLRKAHSVIKNFPQLAITTPRTAGNESVNDPKNALAALNALAEEQRRRNPYLTFEQAFARVYAAPENRALAAREREQNRPTA